MFEDDDDVDFDLDLSLSNYDRQESSPPSPIPSSHPAGQVSTNRKSLFSISAMTDPEPSEESHPVPVMRQQLNQPEPALKKARREGEEQSNSAGQTFKVPPRPRENNNRNHGGGGGSGGGGSSVQH